MKFEKTYCSQCGAEFGPGDSGYSHCKDHRARAGQPIGARQTVGGDRLKPERASELAAPQPMRQFNGTPVFAKVMGLEI